MEYPLFAILVTALLIGALLILRWWTQYWKSAEGRWVLVTGCDTGIGNALAHYLHGIGVNVFACCLNPTGSGAESFRCLNSPGLIVVDLDISNHDSVASAVSYVESKLPEGDVLWGVVNNAGVLVYGEFDWLTQTQCERQVQVNLLGTMRVVKGFLHLIRQSKGRIINVTSVNGKAAFPGCSVYCATKFALEGFSDALRNEVKKLGVRVIVVQPGDYAKITSLFAQHKINRDAQLNEMTEEKQEYYGQYFHRFHQHILDNFGLTSPPHFDDGIIFPIFKKALFSETPSIRYMAAPRGFRLFYWLISWMSDSILDQFIELLHRYVFKFEFKID